MRNLKIVQIPKVSRIRKITSPLRGGFMAKCGIYTTYFNNGNMEVVSCISSN
ncbi:MAG: hypothetical protein U9P72_02300 [Campylobacterota bacterium]|nr:hypothetical protein [Campylobacterota bacterium]